MLEVVGIACHNDWNIQFFAELEYLLVYLVLLFVIERILEMAVILDFEIVAVAKDTLVPLCSLTRAFVLALFHRVAYLTTHTGAQHDQSFVILLEQIMVYSGEVIVAIEISGGTQPHEILVTLVIHGQQDEVIALFIFLGVFIGVFPRRNVRFNANQGLYAFCLGLFVEFD